MKHFFLILLCFVPFFSDAAEMHVGSPLGNIRIGDTFILDVTLISEEEPANAVEGVLSLSDSLAIKEIRTASSIVPLWVIAPSTRTQNSIEFAGVIPGGFQGLYGSSWIGMRPGIVTSLVLEAIAPGEGAVSFSSGTRVLSNDGFGTPLPLQVFGSVFAIGDKEYGSRAVSSPNDVTPPELFELHIIDGNEIGKSGPALIFETSDKQTQVSYYEIAFDKKLKREDELSWTRVESPYALSRVHLSQYIFIRAVDEAGNTRLAYLPPNATVSENMFDPLWVLLFVALFGVLWLVFRRRFGQSD